MSGLFQMMNYLISAIAVLVMSGAGARLWHRIWRNRRIEAHRCAELALFVDGCAKSGRPRALG